MINYVHDVFRHSSYYFQAQESVNPQLFTIATLTGHAIRAYGEDYSVCILSSLLKISVVVRKMHSSSQHFLQSKLLHYTVIDLC